MFINFAKVKCYHIPHLKQNKSFGGGLGIYEYTYIVLRIHCSLFLIMNNAFIYVYSIAYSVLITL